MSEVRRLAHASCESRCQPLVDLHCRCAAAPGVEVTVPRELCSLRSGSLQLLQTSILS